MMTSRTIISPLLLLIGILCATAPAFVNAQINTNLFSGATEGIGTHFEITDSNYLNITLDSSERVYVSLESVPETIVIGVIPIASNSASTTITISGLPPNAWLFKYEDNYHNLIQFRTDSNGAYSFAQDTTSPHIIFIQPKQSTKFIRNNAIGGDCQSIGVWNALTKTCTLVQDVGETIQIDDNGITLDGNNHTVLGDQTGSGVYIFQAHNITVKNLHIRNFTFGVRNENSNNNTFQNNTVEQNMGIGIFSSRIGFDFNPTSNANNHFRTNIVQANSSGIILNKSYSAKLNNNAVSNNTEFGITVGESNISILTDNIMTGNRHNLNVGGQSDAHHDHTISTTNTVNGKKVYYLKNISGQTFDATSNLGTFYCINCDGITVRNLNLSHNGAGVYLWGTNNGIVENITSTNSRRGIYADAVDSVFQNNILDGNFHGLFLQGNRNTIQNNVILDSPAGIFLQGGDANVFRSNMIRENNGSTYTGFYLRSASNSEIYNNNFINNFTDVIIEGALANNIFNRPLPTGGNYWDKFDAPAEGCGDTNRDTICDTTHFFTGGQDNLPWTTQDGWAEQTVQKINVAVILSEFADAPHLSMPTTEQPCKLIPPKLYQRGHDAEYYADLAFCVEDYYDENSFGTVDLDFMIFDNGGNWFDIGENKSAFKFGDEIEFVKEAITRATSTGFDPALFDIIAVAHQGKSFQFSKNISNLSSQTWRPGSQPFGPSSFKFLIAENDPIGPWAHEIGHLIGELVIPVPDNVILPDLYKMGLDGAFNPLFSEASEGLWSLMSTGSYNPDNKGNDPSYISAFLKEFLGLLVYDIHQQSDTGTHSVSSLDTAKFGDSVFRYNLEDNIEPDTEIFYILDVRNSTIGINKWDKSLPLEKALILYKIDSKGLPKFGYKDGDTTKKPNIERWAINIPHGGILVPGGESFLDLSRLNKFTALSDAHVGGKYIITARIQDVSASQFIRQYIGVIMDPDGNLRAKSEDFDDTVRILPPMHGFPLSNQKLFNIDEDSFEISYHNKSYDCCLYKLGIGIYILLAAAIVSFGFRILSKTTPINLSLPRKLFSLTKSKVIFSSFLLVGVLVLDIRYLFAWFFEPDLYSMGYTMSMYVTNIVAGLFIVYILVSIILFVWLEKGNKQQIFQVIKIFIIIAVAIILLTVPMWRYGERLTLTSGTWRYSDIAKQSSAVPTRAERIINSAVPRLEPIVSPDLDLHAITSDGRHVGMNYKTGEYEIEISETETSGDILDDEEWIFLPADEEAVFYVSSRDNQVFLDTNPDIATHITDASDSYSVFARFIDPGIGIFTSQTIKNQLIDPGKTATNALFGTSSISIASGTLRTIPAKIKITPKTLNLGNKGLFSVMIEIKKGSGASVIDIETATIKIQNITSHRIIVAQDKFVIALFKTQELEDIEIGEYTALTLTGRLNDGTPFEGTDTVRIIGKGAVSRVSLMLANLYTALVNVLEALLY